MNDRWEWKIFPLFLILLSRTLISFAWRRLHFFLPFWSIATCCQFMPALRFIEFVHRSSGFMMFLVQLILALPSSIWKMLSFPWHRRLCCRIHIDLSSCLWTRMLSLTLEFLLHYGSTGRIHESNTLRFRLFPSTTYKLNFNLWLGYMLYDTWLSDSFNDVSVPVVVDVCH